MGTAAFCATRDEEACLKKRKPRPQDLDASRARNSSDRALR